MDEEEKEAKLNAMGMGRDGDGDEKEEKAAMCVRKINSRQARRADWSSFVPCAVHS